MALIAFVLSVVVAALGALGVVSPLRLLTIVRRFQTPAGLFAAAAFRVVLGVALVVTATGSRTPDALRILGIVIIVSGLVTPFFGVERFGRLLDWWSTRSPAFMRSWAAIALLVGLLLAYLVTAPPAY
jgi:hypothetical protein